MIYPRGFFRIRYYRKENILSRIGLAVHHMVSRIPNSQTRNINYNSLLIGPNITGRLLFFWQKIFAPIRKNILINLDYNFGKSCGEQAVQNSSYVLIVI